MVWISIMDRLPEQGQLVIVKFSYKRETFAVCFLSGTKFFMDYPDRIKLMHKDHMQFCFKKNLVTFWMPLPKQSEAS